jgi:hypothetical protein
VVIHESARHGLGGAGHQAFEESPGTTPLVESVCQDRRGLTDSGFDPDERLRGPITVYVQQDDITHPNEPWSAAEGLDRLMLRGSADSRDYSGLGRSGRSLYEQQEREKHPSPSWRRRSGLAADHHEAIWHRTVSIALAEGVTRDLDVLPEDKVLYDEFCGEALTVWLPICARVVHNQKQAALFAH